MRLFVDTSAWLALSDKGDQHHGDAQSRISRIKKEKIEMITSSYVFDEAVTIIRYRVSHATAVTFGETLMSSSIVTVADISDEDRFRAWTLFRKYSDKTLSFTDCTSFVLMKTFELQKAFAFDDHFKQVGFQLF